MSNDNATSDERVKLFFVRPSEILVSAREYLGKFLMLSVTHMNKKGGRYDYIVTDRGISQGDPDMDIVPFVPDVTLVVINPDEDWRSKEVPTIYIKLGPYDRFYFERREKETDQLIFVHTEKMDSKDKLYGASPDIGFSQETWPKIIDGTLWTLGD